ncbi:uncharacterized protein LOC105695174 [Orussus abietinus]|uniref:uncharacterized protein LOC105695174 n=1 Tax=Orussus abietinus TaxID=222816 RepID=UPI000625C00A|nr:uncharacterized protein LOC105695174 [Orussus abietinus]
MPIKYIGRTTDFKGKTVWEILGNLKNFGIGRVLYRNQFQRYPEPCYFKVLKVAALPNQENRKVTVLVQETFRGKTLEKPVQMESTTYKDDYVLVPKDQEEEFCKPVPPRPMTILSRTAEFPPLLKELLMRQIKVKDTSSEEVRLPVVLNLASGNMYRMAEEGETPTEEVTWKLGKPASPSLYANIKP